MVLFAQILLKMKYLWLFWPILPVLILLNLLLLYLFNQIQSQHFHFAYDVFRHLTTRRIRFFVNLLWKMPFLKNFWIYVSRSVFFFILTISIRHRISSKSFLAIEKGAQIWAPHSSNFILCKIKTSVTILLTPCSESSSIAPDALHNIYVSFCFVKNNFKKLRFSLQISLYKYTQ